MIFKKNVMSVVDLASKPLPVTSQEHPKEVAIELAPPLNTFDEFASYVSPSAVAEIEEVREQLPVSQVTETIDTAPIRVSEVVPIKPVVINAQRTDAERFSSTTPVDKPIEDILVSLGVNAAYVRVALTRQRVLRRPLSEVARDTGLISAEKIAEAVSIQTGFPFFKSSDIVKISNIDVVKIKEIMGDWFKFNGFVPIGFHNGSLMVAIASVNKASEAKNSFSQHKPRLVITSDKNIQSIYRKYFSNTDLAFDKAVEAGNKSVDDVEDENLTAMQDLLGDLLRHAAFVGASDIYLFSDEKEGTIKLKVAGRGQIFRFLTKRLFMRLTQLIVTMTGKGEGLALGPQDAKLELKDGLEVRYKDVAERYVFRMNMVKDRGTGDIRVVIRLNDSQSSEAEFDQLGFDIGTIQAIKGHISNPHGLVLISGPTGSGKTTTLYAILREINSLERQVLTMEKPIEYRNGSWIQYELRGDNEEGVESREMLNAMLRQSPDVIFMGELRDNSDLAKVCVTAANTGHLVFSTIHTNDGPSTITRLLNLNVSSVDIASVLSFVLAMRLVPLLCEHCKVPDPRQETHSQMNLDFLNKHHKTPHKASVNGCEHCEFTGIRGRKSVYEYMDGHAATALLTKGSSIDEIRQKVYQKSETMWGRGLVLVAAGLVSIDDLRMKVGKY